MNTSGSQFPTLPVWLWGYNALPKSPVRLARLLKLACAIVIPTGLKAREKLTDRLHGIFNRVCAKSLGDHKADTLRKRLIADALDLFQNLLTGTGTQAQAALFSNSSLPENS